MYAGMLNGLRSSMGTVKAIAPYVPRDRVLSALAPAGGYQSSWGTLLLLGGMKRDAVPGMSINGGQASV
jgi:hypothetical protein